MRIKSASLLLLLFYCSIAFAQQDKFAGTWQMITTPTENIGSITMQLHIANPERDQLYPATLQLTYENFKATYSLLLVKKNNGELAIGRNKVPEEETPFTIGAWTIFLNGVFKLEKPGQVNAVLVANRIVSKRYGVSMPALTNFAESERSIAFRLKEFLQEADIRLSKINDVPWQGEKVTEILTPYISPTYYGIMDTIVVRTNTATINFADDNRVDNDTVSVMLNGKTIIDKTDLSRSNPKEEIKLDTGLNILIFFADNYGKVPPNTGKMNVSFGKEKFAINFANKADISSTFIVVKLYYYPIVNNLPPPELLRNTKLVDSMHTTSGEITLAIWDDAVEDGDSISLNINGEWLAKGLAVKKKPQFLKVTLQPGINNIIFVADNEGSISHPIHLY